MLDKYTGIFKVWFLHVGNGDANGPFIHCGFRPKIVQIRRLNGGAYGNYDTERDPINPASKTSNWVDNGGAELSDGNTPIDILSNGFKIRTPYNCKYKWE